MSLAGASRGDFFQNPHRQALDRVESFEIVAQSIGGESGEPESDFGSLLRKLIHLSIPNDSAEPSSSNHILRD
jgi:hypothetical protein